MAKRNYENNYPSVTGCLDVLRKIGLEFWFKVNTPQFIEEKSAKGKEIGKQIHAVIQSYIETGTAKIDTQYAEEVSTALKSFMLFRKENPTIVMRSSEIPLTSEVHKFNGTIDCMGEEILIDWKTGEAKKEDKPKIYDEYKYQVAAYVHLWNEVKKDNIGRAIIVAVAKDKVAYNMYEMSWSEIQDCFNEVFLSTLKIKNFQNRKDK
jgi:hypothetical protein